MERDQQNTPRGYNNQRGGAYQGMTACLFKHLHSEYLLC